MCVGVLRNGGVWRTMQCMQPRRTTSFRYSADEAELLDAWAAYLKAASPHLIRGTHSDALRHLMKRSGPPTATGEHEARIRRAHSTLFGKTEAP